MISFKLCKDDRLSDIRKLKAEVSSISSELREILSSDVFLCLRKQSRHCTTNTYDHCIRTAWISMMLADKWHMDRVSVAKAALLHDFCDRWHATHIDVGRQRGFYLYSHPIMAAKNAAHYFGITKEQRRAILSHMFPTSIYPPVNRMAWILIIADNTAAWHEFRYLQKESDPSVVRHYTIFRRGRVG